MFMHLYTYLSNFVYCMNEYNEINGLFRYSEFAYTMKQVQETVNYFYSTRKTFHTWIDLKGCKNSDQYFFVLEFFRKKIESCLHCKFLKRTIAQVLDMNDTDDRFVQDSLKCQGNEINDILRKDIRKCSVMADKEMPSLVHLTFNNEVNNYIISCFNGKCSSSKDSYDLI